MAKYKIVGPRTVAGSAPGKTVELDLPEANIAALVKAGHIAPVPPGKGFAKPVETRNDTDVIPAADEPRGAR